MRRITLLLTLLLATFLAAGCGEFGKRYTNEDTDTTDASGAEKRITDDPFDDAARKAAGCTEVEEFESEGSTHIDPAETPKFEHNPPHSGDHWNDQSIPAPAEYGLYDTTLKEGQWVHNLEHGHIVISHKGLSKKDEDALYDMADINNYHLVVMPRKKNPKDGIFYTAWTAEMYCKKPSKAALQYMIDEWRDQGPELFTQDAEMESNEKDS